eukprot:1175940-Pyramimonas_sp.AAC.1
MSHLPRLEWTDFVDGVALSLSFLSTSSTRSSRGCPIQESPALNSKSSALRLVPTAGICSRELVSSSRGPYCWVEIRRGGAVSSLELHDDLVGAQLLLLLADVLVEGLQLELLLLGEATALVKVPVVLLVCMADF